MKSFRVFVVLLASCVLASALAFSQSTNATVMGRVLDPMKAAVPEASIEITNIDTNVSYHGKTNGEGLFSIPELPPGNYRMSVSKAGFRSIVKPDVTLHTQDVIALNFDLPLGSASEVITVEGGAPLVNTESAAVSTVVDRQFVENLPLNGRSFNTLLQLTPGVVIAPSTPQSAGQFSIAGQRTDANNLTIDGVSANFGVGLGPSLGQSGTGSAQAFSALGGTSSLVSVDALQEFRTETSSFAPEFGRTPGGQVVLTTRSGTNEFHGGVFDYLRNTVMDASNWFNGRTIPPTPKAPEHHNDFGGFLGGPIHKDRTFFFLSYEGARLAQPQTEVIQVPSELARASAPASLAPFINAFPEPNGQPMSPTDYTAPFTGSYSNSATLDAGSVRIDHTFNDKFIIFGRYNYAPSQSVQRVASLSNLQTAAVNTQTLTVGLNMLFSARISNSIRGNLSTQHSDLFYSLDAFGGAVPISSNLLLPNLSTKNNLAYFQSFDTNYYQLGSGGQNSTKQMNLTDDFQLSAGAHHLKFGGDYREIFLNVDPYQNEPFYLVFSTQGFLATGSTDFFFTETNFPTKFLTQALSTYAQDTWKVTPKLTLTYGVRWEVNPAPSARDKTSLAAWQNVRDPYQIAIAPAGTPLWATTYGNFAPRVGIAYSLTNRGDWVVRAGGGIFYDLGLGRAADLSFSFPNSFATFAPNATMPIADLTPYLPTISLQPPYDSVVTGFSPDLKLPRSYQWNVALEKSFGGKQDVSVTYVGQAGRDLLRQQSLPSPNSNFIYPFELTVNDARSNYHALEAQYRRPLASRLQILLNYTWAHSLDNASDDIALALSNAVISGANDYASSGFDVRHSFSGALSYNPPALGTSGPLSVVTKDWSIDTVIVVRTGFPYNALITTPSALGGIGYTRPDLVPGRPLYLYGAQCTQTFGPVAQGGNGVLPAGQPCPGGRGLNPSAFVIPSSPRQGTEGRNDIPGFGLTQVDLSIGRKFPLRERANLQFRADAFNLLNHPNFANPFPTVDAGPVNLLSPLTLNQRLGGLNPLFQEGGPRSLQVSLKLTF